MRSFQVGDTVHLTPSMRRAALDLYPERYQIGTITRIGSWGIVDVKWNGINRPIGMRSDEIELAVE